MRHTLTAINADQLRQLYVEEQLTSTGVATLFRCSSTTVRRVLRQCGIRARAPGPLPRRRAHPARLGWTAELAYAVGL